VTDHHIDVISSGAILLGPDITCDGFNQDRAVRVQTHCHTDHMSKFSTSKSGEILLSHGTYHLLMHDNPEFEFRANIHRLESNEEFLANNNKIKLLSAGSHMLGAMQVQVQLNDGVVVGYSGDFNWPMDETIKVNKLVLDATNGLPESQPAYSQDEVERQFVELVTEKIRHGPVNLFAYSAVAERSLAALYVNDVLGEVAIIGDQKFCHSVDVHRKFDVPLPTVINARNTEAYEIIKSGNYIRYWSLTHGMVDGLHKQCCIKLTRFAAPEPIVQRDLNHYTAALSNHASYSDTIKYVESTGGRACGYRQCEG